MLRGAKMVKLITKFKLETPAKDVSDFFEQVRILETAFDDIIEETKVVR